MPDSTREQIVKVADDLFYRQGFDATSFSDIAAGMQISRGNFYYHFKTKDQILDAVIDLRLANTRDMLERWQADGATPVDRIGCFISILIANQAKIMAYGCPVGTLCAELAKLDHAAGPDARRIFSVFRDWLRDQFVALGRAGDADDLALTLLGRSQGVAAMATAFQDADFVRREVKDMQRWVAARAAEAGPDQPPIAENEKE